MEIFQYLCLLFPFFTIQFVLLHSQIHCHVTYAFQGEFTLHSCLNVKELLAWSRREIWNPVWPNGWVFVYKRSGSGFESSCSRIVYYYNRYTVIIFYSWKKNDNIIINIFKQTGIILRTHGKESNLLFL